MLTFKTRRAAGSDAKDLCAVINSAYRGEPSKEGWTSEADLVGGLRIDLAGVSELLGLEKNHFIVAVNDADGLLGSVHVIEEAAGVLYFGLLAVNPKFQTAGIGKRLLAEVEKLAQVQGARKIRIMVLNVRDELISYYERRGFRLSGQEEKFPFEELLKVKGLKLVEMVKDLGPVT
ncbi:MAG TPA: GNAT family N-acetyltransferase [Bacteriovoracaceae bacterium]|nr:GNAT family N-acetyltransferase [Bacteriovoracaceae bacterium]